MRVNNLVIHQESSPASGVMLVVALCGLLISIITVFFVALTYFREERFSSVFSEQSLSSFRKPIKLCETMRLTLFNHSKHTASLQPTIYAENLSVHPYTSHHPLESSSQLTYAGYTIKVDDRYDTTFQVHTLVGNPSPAKLSVYVNNLPVATFWYAWDTQSKSYINTGWN